MIVKILNSASSEFNGVRYNDKKINSEKGELMLMKNFPSFINKESPKEEVRNYLKSISVSNKVQKPQFHAVISTKFQEHSKEQLTQLADDFMREMGYGEQPYIIVAHNDTDNNHVHIVSTRVSKSTGKKINDSFEKLKSQKALSKAMEKNFGISYQAAIDDLLKYRYSNYQQLEKLLTRNGFKVVAEKENTNVVNILKNGVSEKRLFLDGISYGKGYEKDRRSKQIKAFLEKYKDIYSNKVFKVVDDREEKGMYERGEDAKDILPKIEYESELQHKLREIFGIDIVFHFKDDKQPFGYTLIDNSTDTVYKGSDILKMKDVFQFTEDTIEKKTFERLKYYNLRTENEKQIMLDFFKRKGVDAKDFMLFENKSFKGKNKEFQTVKGDVKEYVKNPKSDTPISIVKNEDGDFYAIHERYHQVHKLEYLIGRTAYERFTNPEMNANNVSQMREHQHVGEANILEDLGRELEKNTSVGRDTTEDDLKKRRKKRK